MSDTPEAPATPASAGATVLDLITVGGATVTMAGVLLGLFTVTVPDGQLPVIASLAGALVGTVLGGYAGFRWGASETMKKIAAASPAR